jgi:hypothetical protein
MESFIDRLIADLHKEEKDPSPAQVRARLTLCYIQGYFKVKELDDLNLGLEEFFKTLPYA